MVINYFFKVSLKMMLFTAFPFFYFLYKNKNYTGHRYLVDNSQFYLYIPNRGGGTGGAGGAIAPPTFAILPSKQPLAPPTFLVGSVNSSTTNFSYLPPPLP